MKSEIEVDVPSYTNEDSINIIIQSIEDNKQILIFNASKSTAQSSAKKTVSYFKKSKKKVSQELQVASEKILNALQTPTSQCRDLAEYVKYGVAFHHSGLVAKQRMIIEDLFKERKLDAISSTPTLAAGLNLPATISYIKDYKRFSKRGFQDIPVLEYQQMAGRAGRPGIEKLGFAIVNVKDEDEQKRVSKKFIFGETENIYSKLAVEPTLKMYLLSLISMDSINSQDEIFTFFNESLYGFQFKNQEELQFQIKRILKQLQQFGFIDERDSYFVATPLGKKVSELYLNPDSAYYYLSILSNISNLLKKGEEKTISKEQEISLIHSICNVVEIKPFFYIKKKEEEEFYMLAQDLEPHLLSQYDPYNQEINDFLSSIKTATILHKWANELPEDMLLTRYNITPGELNYKLQVFDWVLYCIEELLHLKKELYAKSQIKKLRIRMKYGVRLELLPLLALKGVGRKRARQLYERGATTPSKIKELSHSQLTQILGEKRAKTLLKSLRANQEELQLHSLVLEKPQEIRSREVSSQEVEILLQNDEEYKENISKMKNNLLDYF